VVEVAEKKVISSHATTGIYYFKSGRMFQQFAENMISKDIRVNNEFYVAPVYNEIIHEIGKVGIWEIKSSEMHGIGTPEDLDEFFKIKGGYISKSIPVK